MSGRCLCWFVGVASEATAAAADSAALSFVMRSMAELRLIIIVLVLISSRLVETQAGRIDRC